MLVEAPGRGWLLGDQSGGTAVRLSALGTREFRIDAAADDRMDECQRPAGLEETGGRQQLGCLGCLKLVEACELRRLEKVALLENGQWPSEPPRVLGAPAEPEANPAADRSGPDSRDVAAGPLRWSAA